MIIKTAELQDVRAAFQSENIALRFGCYDLLHAGHQTGIDYTASHADIVVLGVLPDAYVKRVKGPDRPINPAEARIEAIDQAPGVDFSVLVQSSTLALAGVFLRLRPDMYVEDQEHASSRAKRAFMATLGIEYVVDRQSRLGSSSQMIANLGLAEAVARSALTYVHH